MGTVGSLLRLLNGEKRPFRSGCCPDIWRTRPFDQKEKKLPKSGLRMSTASAGAGEIGDRETLAPSVSGSNHNAKRSRTYCSIC